MFSIRQPLSDCNKALYNAGLPLDPPTTGVRYSNKELLAITESASAGEPIDMWRHERRRVAMTAIAARRDRMAAD